MSYLSKLPESKAQEKIREKYSESDFIALLEATIWQAHDAGILEQLEGLMASLEWSSEFDSVKTFEDLAGSEALLPYAERFKASACEYPEDFIRFEQECLAQPIKDTFYKSIFPKGLHDKTADI